MKLFMLQLDLQNERMTVRCHIFGLIEKINVPILFLNMCAKRAFVPFNALNLKEKKAEFFCTINE